MRSRVTRKFQVTIPKEIRKALNISIGDEVVWEIGKNNVAILRKLDTKKKLEEFRGVWRKHPLLKKFGDSATATRWLRGHETND